MEILGTTAYFTVAHALIAKILGSDIKAATALGVTNSLAFWTTCVIDHTYAGNDELAHSVPFRIARTCALFFISITTVKVCTLQGHKISYIWPVVSVLLPAYLREVQMLSLQRETPPAPPLPHHPEHDDEW